MSAPHMEPREILTNPLDLVEQLANTHEWPHHRHNEEELAAEIDGQWCHYRLWFAWHPDIGAMHFSCAFDMKVPEKKRESFFHLLALANEKLWLGHFELWHEENLPVFRYSCLFRRESGASNELLADLVEIAVNECDRFYPAFQFLIWAGRGPKEAIMAALLETEGEA